MSPQRKYTMALIGIFVLLSIFFLSTKSLFLKWRIDNYILLLANAILFIISIVIFIIQHKALVHSNPNVFMRSVMLGMMIKMFVCAGAVIVYVLMDPNSFNGTAIFIFMLLYVVYLVAEVGAIMKLNKRTNA
jgi:hypothetical protein